VNELELRERFGDALDGVLPENVNNEFYTSLEQFPNVRTEFELERMTKRLVSSRLKPIPVTMAIQHKVLEAVRNDAFAPPKSESWLRRLFGGKIQYPAIAVGLALVAILFFIFSPKSEAPLKILATTSPNDFVYQSFAVFRNVIDGKFTPELKTTSTNEVSKLFIKHNYDFSVTPKPLECCTSYYALPNEYAGVRLAHVVYNLNKGTLYTMSIHAHEITEDRHLSLPQKALDDLKMKKLYKDSSPDGYNVVLWQKDDVINAAVSTLKSEEIIAMLTPEETQ
jgi:hypothetical protein